MSKRLTERAAEALDEPADRQRPRVLFLVHFEEMFRDFLPDSLLERVCDAIESGEYDRVIPLVSCVDALEPIEEIAQYQLKQWDWGWGYEPEMFEDNPGEAGWVIETPNSQHDYTWVPPEIRDPSAWDGWDIFVGGGCDGECLADWEEILDHLGLEYTRLEEIIYSESTRWRQRPKPRWY